MDNMVTVPREDYNILMQSQTTLDTIRLVASADDNCEKWGHYNNQTSAVIDLLLGIERKEKTD